MTSPTTIEGTVSRIIFEKERFRIVKLQTLAGDIISLKGSFFPVSVSSRIRATGVLTVDPKYGKQFAASAVEEITPDTLEGLEKYLAATFDGIGHGAARRITSHFQAASFDVLNSSPERLSEVLSPSLAQSLAKQWHDRQHQNELMVFLTNRGIGPAVAQRIFESYGQNSMLIVSQQPYRLAREIDGVGFPTADAIAKTVGVEPLALERLQAAFMHALRALYESGHTCASLDMLQYEIKKLLSIDIPDESFSEVSTTLIRHREIILEHNTHYFLAKVHAAEVELASLLHDLSSHPPSIPLNASDIEAALEQYERTHDITLGASQRDAIISLTSNPFLILTGGPGTGKSTILSALLFVFRTLEHIQLAAPTGRAAKRMTEITQSPASTIHRLLSRDQETGMARPTPTGQGFHCNRRNPLVSDLLVIDESSMLDMHLAVSLLSAITPGTRVLLIGDVDQLPSVGPGCVLRDIIDSNAIPVIRLSHVYRQAQQSLITQNAHRILAGAYPESDASRDFLLLAGHDDAGAKKKVVQLVRALAKKMELLPEQIQVLVPQHKGDCGLGELNTALQEAFNPPQPDSPFELMHKGVVYRKGDKVMQLKNDYDHEVFNGEVGKVIFATKAAIQIQFDESVVEYSKNDELDKIRHAYASTIHKSQGSEYPAVIVVLLSSHGWMLTKNLFYTAITRGRKQVVVVTDGEGRAAQRALGGADRARMTGLRERLQKGAGVGKEAIGFYMGDENDGSDGSDA